VLNALKNQLVLLAGQEQERFVAEIERRCHPPSAANTAAALRELIVAMPDLIAQLRAWAGDPRIPRDQKQLQGFLLTYLYHPKDLLPEADWGLFGYLDDAYLVGRIYLDTLRTMRDSPASLPSVEAFGAAVPAWLEFARQVIPVESAKIDLLLNELRAGTAGTPFAAD
jgi:uncharacterized membrane protein YkvA (DUF1232 family)